MGKNTRMQQWINYRVRITLQDGRMLVGTFMAFDKHMNVVLADCEEFRRAKGAKGTNDEKEAKRSLGFLLLRGENIVSFTAEAPPSAKPRRPGEGPTPGVGRAQPGGRGVPVATLGAAPAGLAGPVRGVGGPAPFQMVPGAMGGPGFVGMSGRPMMPIVPPSGMVGGRGPVVLPGGFPGVPAPPAMGRGGPPTNGGPPGVSRPAP